MNSPGERTGEEDRLYHPLIGMVLNKPVYPSPLDNSTPDWAGAQEERYVLSLKL